LVGVLGGGLGLVVAYAGTQSLGAFGLQGLPRGGTISLDMTAVAITLALGVGAGIVFGGIPLSSVLRNDLIGVFQAAGRTGTANSKSVILRNVLVTGQVALAFVLLLGAGLLFRSFQEVQAVEPGFRPEGVLAGAIILPDSRYPDDASIHQFSQELLGEVRALPGVQLASVTSQLPFTGFRSTGHVLPEGYELPAGETVVNSYKNWVGTDYFETLGIPLLEGRAFTEADVIDDRQVIVLDEWLANRYFPNDSAIGKVVLFGALPGMEVDDWEAFRYTVVGVVGSIKQNNLVETSRGAFYFPFSRDLRPRVSLLVRSDTDLTPLVQASTAAVVGIDPELPFFAVRSMQVRIHGSVMGFRSNMLVMTLFSGIALFMAGIGIYGILAFSVTQRTKEMGIRMALGSRCGNLFRVVVGHGLKLVLLGLIIGAVGSAVLARLIQSLLFGVQPSDPVVAVVGAGILVATALLACMVPALRATRIDPLVALRADLE
jgi:predicted permease